ncbi:MAG TPA: glycosyltransferase [Gaiellaceae bacterium]|jgi:cellulose synthase/poly-beta-1,6-N-acetylglucosamine synthase-like glycosyltransferase
MSTAVATPRRHAHRAPGRPLVSCVVTAYNMERWIGRALDSALAQELDGDLELVVVDDGSTDRTAEVLRRFEGISVVRKRNAGFLAAVNTGLEAVTGTYVCLLDGDDEWPAGRLAVLVAELERRPELGLVHGDMRLIDESGTTLSESFFHSETPPLGRGDIFGKLLGGNFVSGGASVFRASLLPRILPIPPAAAFPDWWIAVRIAEVAQIDHVEVPVNLYRRHGSNMSGSRAGRLWDEIRFRRWILTHLNHSRAPLSSLVDCVWALQVQLREALESDPSPFRIDGQRADAAVALAERCVGAVGPEAAARALFEALGHDPTHGPAQAALTRLLPAALDASADTRTRPADARSIAIGTTGDAALETGLLERFAGTVAADADVTLVVVASAGQLADVERRAVAAGLDSCDAPDTLVLVDDCDRVALDGLCLDEDGLDLVLEERT